MTIALKKQKRNQRHGRIRARISGSANSPRLSVFRSSGHIYVKLIDDSKGEVLASASDFELKNRKTNKTDLARKTGELIAQKALALKIGKVVFDRGGFKYHGRVKALAEGAREGGLKF